MTSLFSRLQKLNKEATPPEWEASDHGGRIEVNGASESVCDIDTSYDIPFPREQCESDAALIVECRNSLPAVLNLIEAAQLVDRELWDEDAGWTELTDERRERLEVAARAVHEALAVFVSGQEEPR